MTRFEFIGKITNLLQILCGSYSKPSQPPIPISAQLPQPYRNL